MNVKKVLLGVLGGIGMGALIGTLFAPEKGTVIRHKISKTRKDQVNKLKDDINKFLGSITGKRKSLKEPPAKKGKAEKLKQ
jgi:gas vesicle protein